MFSVTAGRAFWVKLPLRKSVTTYAFLGTSAELALVSGWNMVGLAVDASFVWSLSDIEVVGPNGSVKTLGKAEEAGWVT